MRKILNDFKNFVSISSNHCKRLPFVLVLGVATSTTALLNMLSFYETTRIKLRVFTGQPSNQVLDQILDDVILTPKCPFQLGSKVLEYLKSVFVFYDLTSKNFLKSTHYCLLDQYSRGNAYSVCSTTFQQAKKNIAHLKHEDFETIRRLLSMRPYVEGMMNDPKNVIAFFKDDEFLRRQLIYLVADVYTYFLKFYGYIRFLWTLVKDLPKSPLGKRLSDIYTYCHASHKSVTATEEFEKCWQLLGMMSKDEFIALLEKAHKVLEEYDDKFVNKNDLNLDKGVFRSTLDAFDHTYENLSELINELRQDHHPAERLPVEASSQQKKFASRTEFNQFLMQQQKQSKSDVNNVMRKILKFIRIDVIEKHLPQQNQAPPLLELFVYSDYDKIKSHLRGTSRSAIHKALTDPHCYLQVFTRFWCRICVFHCYF